MRTTLIASSFAMLAAAAHAQSPHVAFGPPSRALHDSVAAAQLRFFFEWGRVWRLSEDDRSGERQSSATTVAAAAPSAGRAGARGATPGSRIVPLAPVPYSMRNDSTRPRNQHLHCHPGTRFGAQSNQASAFTWNVRPGSMIRSQAGAFAVCPTWAFETINGDERRAIDTAIMAPLRVSVRIARRSVLRLIEAAADLHPTDPFFVGQRIRFLLDQQSADSALKIAEQCRAGVWWCASLTGYVLTELRQPVRADSAFDVALNALTPAERCTWTNFSFLLDATDRSEYARLNCELRASLNARLWWLADPLFLVPGNERRVEQYSRKVQVALRRMVERDERYDWRLVAGGDAMEEMLVRYGWPAYTWWGGQQNDKAHSGYLKGFSSPTFPGPLHEPYTTFEYSRGRQHHVPAWRALLDPLTARATDWQISAPDSGFGDRNDLHWWPAEHFDGAHPMHQLIEGQVAMLRRDTSVILATSHDLMRSRLPRALGGHVNATLLVTDRPNTYRVLSEINGPVDHRLILHGHIESRPILVGIEIPPVRPSRNYAARTRFSVAPPPTLAAMTPTDLAISDPVVLVAPPGDEPSPVEFEAAVRDMASSTKVPPTRRIAVYWETYGFAPSDTVDVAVWIERYTSQGVLRRFGNALRVTTDLNTPVAITWREPQPGTRAQITRGRVPIIARSVVLDASKLPRGSYWLDVAVAKPGQTPVRSRRGIVVE